VQGVIGDSLEIEWGVEKLEEVLGSWRRFTGDRACMELVLGRWRWFLRAGDCLLEL